MKKSVFFASLTITAVLLSGCSSTTPPAAVSATIPEIPEPAEAKQLTAAVPVSRSTPLQEMQNKAVEIREAGGLATVGTGESKSLELALNKAKVNGRKELAQLLTVRIEALEKAFTEETGTPPDSLFLSGFNNAAKVLTEQQIAGSIAQSLKYETDGSTFNACALMVLNPKEIFSQLAKEKEIFDRLQATKAFDELRREVASYETFAAARK